MPVTSCTSGDNACFAETAMMERQYQKKNCKKSAAEQTRMIAAIIAAPPQGVQAPAALLHSRARTNTSKPQGECSPAAASCIARGFAGSDKDFEARNRLQMR